ncbi:MAG: MMPL family transporter, partial [Actinomycetia bacterium]|nr:MMPL family transporter [Actinomycetes bacterium]
EEATRLAGELGPVVKIVSVSGDVIASQDSLAAFTDAMMVSLPIALILTVVIVGLVLRSVRYSTVTILPILLVVFGVWGYMWLRGFTINVVTATIAAIAVGVGIDFCTHFSVRFREELTAGFDRMTAVRRAGEGTGSALAVSAFTSIVGFGVMTAAPAPIFASFGELMAVMIALSALVALLVLPCLLVVVTPAKTTIDAGSPGDDVDLHTEPQTSMPIEGPPIVVMVES